MVNKLAKTSDGLSSAIKSTSKAMLRAEDKYINPEKGWPGEAGVEEYYKDTTEDEELKQKILEADAANAAAAVARTNAFSEIEDLFNNEILILNDIVLDRIPTTSISITYTSDIFVSETIRTSSPSVSTNGREDVIVELNLVFPPGEKQAVTLRRLMAELTNHPFVFIYNNKIRQSLPIKDSENTIFVLENGVIRSLANQPGSIGLDLVLHYFNHRPFSKHFFYNSYLPGNSPQESKPAEATPLNPGATQEEYSETVGTKQALDKSKQASKILADQRSRNAPALLPRHSEPWMYYANLLTEEMPILNSKYSDYVGFKLDKLVYISPPNQAAEGNSIKDLIDSHLNIKEVQDPWIVKEEEVLAKAAALAQKGQDDREATSPNREAEAYAYSEGRGDSTRTIPPSSSDNFDWYKARRQLISNGIEPWKSAGTLQPGFHLSENLQDETGYVFNYKGASKCNILFFETLHRSAYRVPIVERKRGSGYPGVVDLLKSIATGESKNWCTRLTGKSVDEIQTIINSGTPVGLAWRNDAHIVILEEIKDISYDASGQVISTRISYYDQHNLGASGLRRFTFTKNGQIEVFSAIKDKNKKPITFKQGGKLPVKDIAQQEVDKAKTRQEKAIQKIKDLAKNKQTPVEETKGPVHKSMDDRIRWIREIEARHDLIYYLRNKNVRNVFYDTLSLSTSGAKEDYDSGISLPNIACTAIAVSFGHKLAPIGLVSQKHYSYQFVGSGNKSGQLVFTFAGEKGRSSAEALKNLFSIAKDNATYFGQLLDEAGSLDLVSEDYVHNRQNAILALAGVSNVIISNVEERSIPGSSDRYGLVVDFVARENKIKNELERRFPSPLESKRKLVKRLLRYLDVDSNGHIITDPNIVQSRITGLYQNERQYRAGKNVPPWVAEVVSAAKEVCERANKESPPLDKTQYEYWYEPWGAKKLITGKNIKEFAKEEFKVQRTYSDAFAGERGTSALWNLFGSGDEIPASSGQKVTRSITTDIAIKNVYKDWSAEMERLIRKIKSHISDEVNFKKFFGADILNEIHETIAYGTSGCYKDLSLPSYIGTNVSMPPEFYVYDDSDDDSVSGSNKYNPETTRRYLRAVLERELESHNKLSLNSIASNLYISQNYADIKDKRLGELGLKKYELKEFEEDNLFSSGALAWGPIHYRNGFKDELWETDSVKQWRKIVEEKYSENNPSSMFGFLDEVMKLSSVIQDYNHQNPERLINNAFGEDWGTLSFGPNLKNLYVDAAAKGNPIDKQTQDFVNSATDPEALKKEASRTGKDVTVGHITVTPDGAVTVGNTLEEKAQQKREASIMNEAGAAFSDLELGRATGTAMVATAGGTAGFTAAVAGAGMLKGLLLGAGIVGKQAAIAGTVLGPKGTIVIGALGAIAGAAAGAYLAYKYGKESEKQQLNELVSARDQETILNKLNNTYQKLMPEIFNKSRVDILADTATTFSLAAKSKDINFRRAFPTFKVYFIEDDTHDSYMADGKIIRAFDDFYSYSAIEEIRVIKSKDIAADLAIIRMANLGSNLFAKRFGDGYATAKTQYEDMPESLDEGYVLEKELKEKQGLYAETDEEDPFDKFVFQTGVKVQIRFGYDDDPNKLETDFLGQIVEIATSADGKMLEIVCQGYGAELESVELGRENTDTFFSSQGALSAAIIQPTIVNFGRQDFNTDYNPGQIRNQYSTPEGVGIIREIKDSIFGINTAKGMHDKYLRRYTFLNYPQDDNIFAPSPSSYAGWYEKFWNNALTYRPIQQTPWSIFKEHELRHPGYISLPVPYGHTSRMTMFFGSKSQHYWCKPPSSLEVVMAQSAQEQMTRMRGLVATSTGAANQATDKINELARTMPTMAEAVLRDILGRSAAINVSAEIGRTFGRYVPFRNFHYFDSSYHILSNNIKCSSENVANEVEIKYFENEDGVDEDDARSAVSNGGSSYKVKLDDNLPEDKIKTYYDEYPSCITKFMAKRYAQGLFGQILNEAYGGELTVIGDETIKPYNIINIEDKTINMSGPAEVKQVIHVFNRSDGFISIISPGMCVSINEGFDVPLMNTITAHQRLVWDFLKNDTSDDNSISAHVAAYKLPSVARLPMFYKLATTEGAPVFIHPMTLSGVPFVPSAIKKTGNLFSSVFGAWSSWWEDLFGAWKRLDVAEELFVARVRLVDNFFQYLTRR